MKSKIVLSLICMMFATALVLAQESAAPEAAPAEAPETVPAADIKAPEAVPVAPMIMPLELRKMGIVNVTRDADGKVTAIKLIVTSYDIQLDEGSKPLETMDGQKVRVTCTLSYEGGKRILTVKSVEPLSEGGAPAPAAPAVETPVTQ